MLERKTMRGTVVKWLRREATRIAQELNPPAKRWDETVARVYSKLKKEYKNLPKHIQERESELRLQSAKEKAVAKGSRTQKKTRGKKKESEAK
jgi:hypothetical protein